MFLAFAPPVSYRFSIQRMSSDVSATMTIAIPNKCALRPRAARLLPAFIGTAGSRRQLFERIWLHENVASYPDDRRLSAVVQMLEVEKQRARFLLLCQ